MEAMGESNKQADLDPIKIKNQFPLSTIPSERKSFLPRAILIILILVLISIFVGKSFFIAKESAPKLSKISNKQTAKVSEGKFAHFQYLSKPTFGNSAPSSMAQPSEYSTKNPLPSAEEVAKKSRISVLLNKSIILIAYAGGKFMLPVYRENRHEVTKQDATSLAQRFGFSGEPKQNADTGFITWETNNEYFQISGRGSGTGGFEYFLKGSGLSGDAPSDNEAISMAKKYLVQKGIIDDSYIVSGVLNSVGSISRRSGFDESHKQVYFRKKVDGYPVYDWFAGGGSPITDKVEVWVGVGGRIIYAANLTYWTTINANIKTDYLVKEPSAVFEDIKAGNGKLAWVDYDAINITTSGYGPHAPDEDFVLHGKLTNVVVESVDLAYYHKQESIENPEFYQPIYLFKAQATLDWKDDYKVDYSGDRFIQGKRTTITLVAPAVSNNYFFDNSVTLVRGETTQSSVPVPIYYPQPPQQIVTSTPVTPSVVIANPSQPEKQSFILKLGVVTDLDDPKRNVYLAWEDVPGTVKYNVYLKIAGDRDYNQAALLGTGSLFETIGVNKYIDYYFKVQACNISHCINSNEIFLPQEQKPTFYMKLGTVTPGEDPKTEVYLSWSEYPGTVKYNVFLRNSPTEEYGPALAGIGELSYTAIINRHNDNYFAVQACNDETCYPSNEILLPKQ
jgi:hypothetical protein